MMKKEQKKRGNTKVKEKMDAKRGEIKGKNI
jgi:hypothetical protein